MSYGRLTKYNLSTYSAGDMGFDTKAHFHSLTQLGPGAINNLLNIFSV